MNKGYAMGFISSEIKESEVNTKNGAMKKIRFSVACQKQNGADFPSFVAIGKTADNITKFLGKGKGIFVEYHVQTGSYNDKEGKKVYTTDLVVDRFEFPPVRKDEQNAVAGTHTEEVSKPQEQSQNDFIPTDIDLTEDLPFR